MIYKKIIIFGIGKSGISSINFLSKFYSIIACDDNQDSLSLIKTSKNITICHDIDKIDWKDIDLLLLSPGISLHFPKPHKIVHLARKNNCEIICDIELFYRLHSKKYYIGITGTNGKSTTTSLIHHILTKNHIDNFIGGNIGTPIFEFDNKFNRLTLEISSYQLDLTKNIKFNIAILLNITPDHIDRHGSFDNYINSKKKIFQNQTKNDIAIINIDDPKTRKIYKTLKEDSNFKAKLLIFSTKNIIKSGFSIIDNKIYKDSIYICDISYKNSNIENIIASFIVAYSLNINIKSIIKSIHSFKNLKHRTEFVRNIKNINFINDSKATNAISTENALKIYDNIYWIAGGVSKEGGISSLKKYFYKIQKLYLIGESENEFEDIVKGKIEYKKCVNLKNALNFAYEDAKNNDSKDKINILFSPSCASFDQYKNFEERGDEFIKLANEKK